MQIYFFTKINLLWSFFACSRCSSFNAAVTAVVITHAAFPSVNFVLSFDSSDHRELSRARVILLISGISWVIFPYVFVKALPFRSLVVKALLFLPWEPVIFPVPCVSHCSWNKTMWSSVWRTAPSKVKPDNSELCAKVNNPGSTIPMGQSATWCASVTCRL